MSDIVIRAENLGKEYLIGHESECERYTALRDVLARTAKGFVQTAMDIVRGRQLIGGVEVEEFWALKNVSFEIKRGEVAGIIGRNGAGKSTLLKILSRITEPSEGRVEIRGRIASLLEVGTGFHPELTGRENIFLNGAILGMKRAEIKRSFDEIVDFAGVGRFLDTPVKRYSSGMYVRLAFAVAAHLEPEILVVDEVLAVGDAEFQKKCLGKMRSVSREKGRAVLFVSHNMGAIAQLCSRAILLRNGSIEEDGEVGAVVNAYLRESAYTSLGGHVRRAPDLGKACQITELKLLRLNGDVADRFACDDSFVIEATLDVRQKTVGMYCWLDFTRTDGSLVWMNDSHDTGPNPLNNLDPGQYVLQIEVPKRTVGHGEYFVTLVLTGPTGGDMVLDALENVIMVSLEDLTTRRGNQRPGFLSTTAQWRIRSTSVH